MRDSKSRISQSFVFSEFVRRFNNIVRFGTIAEIDYKRARVRVKTGKITTTWIPWATMAGNMKIWNPPVVGEQVSIIAQGGDLSVAIAIPSIYQNKFSAPSDDENIIKVELSETSSVEFNKENDEITIKIDESELFFNKEKLEAKIGETEAEVSENKIKLSVGNSEIEITPEKIKLHATIIDAPNLKAGGL